MAYYSRRATVEEKRNTRKAVVLIVLTFAIIIFLVTSGFASIGRFASFLADLTKSGKPIEISDTTPPGPPSFDEFPVAANSASLNVSGHAEAGSTVTVTVNGSDTEIVAGSDGRFSVPVMLKKGNNTISAIAKDNTGNASKPSETLKIIFDNEAPKIKVNSPADGSSFSGAGQRQITITGQTEAGVSLLINGRFVSVMEDGSFAFTTTLNEGDNQFEVKAKDAAGNETTVMVTYHFSS